MGWDRMGALDEPVVPCGPGVHPHPRTPIHPPPFPGLSLLRNMAPSRVHVRNAHRSPRRAGCLPIDGPPVLLQELLARRPQRAVRPQVLRPQRLARQRVRRRAPQVLRDAGAVIGLPCLGLCWDEVAC